MKISEAFPSRYLKAADLGGQPRNVTIRAVTMEVLGQGQDQQQKPVAYFESGQKGLVLNKTNANVIKAAYGDDTAAWTGRSITLYEKEVEFQGKITPAIRVRCPDRENPNAPAPMTDADPSDDIPWN